MGLGSDDDVHGDVERGNKAAPQHVIYYLKGVLSRRPSLRLLPAVRH
jgi:hypothetical protein